MQDFVLKGKKMQYIGGIEGMNFTPITEYNKMLKSNSSFQVDKNAAEGNLGSFESVLNKQQESLTQDPIKLEGGIEAEVNASGYAPSSEGNKTNAGHLVQSIGSSLGSGLSSVDNLSQAANKAQESFAMGEDVSVHDVMIAAEKASLSLNMALQLRNKIMAAYTEINNVKV